MRTPRTHVPVAAILAITAGIATGQTTIQVPADQPTIAAGLAAAASGDTVLVAPGTYLEANLSFGGKDLSLVSEAGPGQTVIDAQAAGRVLL